MLKGKISGNQLIKKHNHNTPMKKLLFTIAVLLSSILVFGKDSKSQWPDSYNFRRGVEAVDAKQYEAALEYFNKDISENPKNFVTYCYIAGIRLENKEYGKALEACNAGLNFMPKKQKSNRAFMFGVRSEVYLALNDTVKALADLSEAIKLEADYDFLEKRAQLYYELDKYDLSDADYNAMLKIKAGDAKSFMGLGRNQAAQGNYTEALNLYDTALKYDPSYLTAYTFKILSYEKLEKWDDAIDNIMIALRAEEWNDWAIRYASFVKEPYFQKLIALLDIEQKKNPNDFKWSYIAGLLLGNNGDYKESIEMFEKSNEIEPLPATYQHIAESYKRLGMYENGLESIDKALALDPNDHDGKRIKIDLLYLSGRLADVVKMWDDILVEYPDFSVGYNMRAACKRVMGNTEGAISDFTMATVLDGTNSDAYCQRGDMYKKIGKLQLAEADYKKVIELEDTPEKYQRIFYAYQGLGDTVKAVEILESIIAKDTLDAGSYYDAACLYARMGNKEKSLSYLRLSFEKGDTYSYHVECDDDLQSIRDTDEYKKLVEEYREKQRNSDVLRPQEDSEDGSLSGGGSLSEIPFTKEGGVCKVKCSINELPLYFVFDTGASDVTISLVEANFMFKNGFLSKKDVIGSQSYVDANGDVSVGTVINLKNVTFGGHNLTNVKASVVRNQKAPLLLGQSVLGRLGRIEIDNKNSVIKIKN